MDMGQVRCVLLNSYPYLTTHTKFIELCILLGCDYLEPIKGVGPKSALKLLREHGGLGEVVEHLRERQQEREEAVEEGKKKKGGVQVPEEWPWEKAKELFLEPEVIPADEIEASALVWSLSIH